MNTTPVASERLPPFVWLALILLVGFGARCQHLFAPLQQDEYGPLYATAERENYTPGVLPCDEDRLLPVASWREVRERSILPYGVVNPYPLYNWIQYAFVQVFPVTEFTL